VPVNAVLQRAIAAAIVFVPVSVLAQNAPQRWQGEGRVEVLISRTTAVHAAIGANVIAGQYLRLAVLGAAGVRRVGDEWRSSGRIDLVGRFHVDPQRQFSHGLYVVGGATTLMDDGIRTRIRAVVGAGIESRVLGGESGWIVGAEGGFGGGGRISVTLRRARRGAR
jgi:hypothetical protein